MRNPLIVIAGFLVLTVSEFRATRDFGMLASFTLASALIGSLLFPPTALNLLRETWKIAPRPAGEENATPSGQP